MSKNLIPEIAKMLGVELGEEFKIKGYDDSNTRTYKFTVQGLRVKLTEHPEATEFNALVALNSLLVGDAEIAKLPWKPKMGDTVYAFYSPVFAPFANARYKTNYKWSVDECIWNDTPAARALLKAGWAFKTKAEAIEALPAAARKEGAEYELPDTEEPWKPQMYEEYWTFGKLGRKWITVTNSWSERPHEILLLDEGWIYRTREEAKAALPKVAAEMGVQYVL